MRSTKAIESNPLTKRNTTPHVSSGVGDQKKINKSIKKKLFPGDQKKINKRIKKNYSHGIETLSCGRGAKIASLTGSKKNYSF